MAIAKDYATAATAKNPHTAPPRKEKGSRRKTNGAPPPPPLAPPPLVRPSSVRSQLHCRVLVMGWRLLLRCKRLASSGRNATGYFHLGFKVPVWTRCLASKLHAAPGLKARMRRRRW